MTHGYNEGVKVLASLLCSAALLLAQVQPGNFEIRFEPVAVVQTGADIPFQIKVWDDLHKPLVDAKVTLQIETPQHEHVKVYKAPAIDRGVYMAKPVFPEPGAWNVLVHVSWQNFEGAKTVEYNVPRNAQP